MQITREADYAARAILYLARLQSEKPISTNEIAKRQNIPSPFLAKIFAQLSVVGLLQTARGAKGGVKLARRPQEITLLEVIEAIDGPMRISMCVENECNCTFEKYCPLQPAWLDAQKDLVTKLRNTNFGQLSVAGTS